MSQGANSENHPQPETEGQIHRFSRTERIAHWFNTATFLILVATGVILLLRSPLALSYPGIRLLRTIHYWVGWAYALGPFLIFMLGNPRAGFNWVCESFKWTWSELLWLLGPLRPYLLPRTREPEVGRYNAGQRMNMIIQIVGKMVMLVSGIVIYYNLGALLMYAVHLLMAAFLSAVVVGHIYMSVLHPPTRPSLSGMLSGSVPRQYAARHHPAWFRKHKNNQTGEKPGEKKQPPEPPNPEAADPDDPDKKTHGTNTPNPPEGKP